MKSSSGCAFCWTVETVRFCCSSSTRGCLMETPRPDIFMTGIFFSSFPCAINTAVGVGRMVVCELKACWTSGEREAAWAAGACCTGRGRAGAAVVACCWGIAFAAFGCWAAAGCENMGLIDCLGPRPSPASSPSAVSWATWIRVSSTSKRLFLLAR